MTSYIIKLGKDKLLGDVIPKKYLKNKVGGSDDPYFANVETRKGKFKKVKKSIPSYLDEKDAHILKQAKKKAYRWDMGLFNIGGLHFGWGSVIGFVPEVGDVIDVWYAYNLMKLCLTCEDLPKNTRSKMMFNIVVDFFLGLVPFLGDLADTAFRCNTKNVVILEKALAQKYQIRADEPIIHEDFDGKQILVDNHGRQQAVLEANAEKHDHVNQAPLYHDPQTAGGAEESDNRGWLGRGTQKQRPQDIEMGHGPSAPARVAR